MNILFIETNNFLGRFEDNFQIEFCKHQQATFDGGYTEYANEDHIDYNLWNNPSEYYVDGAEWEYIQIVTKNIKDLNDEGVYFHLCKFKTYEKTYNTRLNEFLEIYEDADPIYFLNNELKNYLKPITFKKPFRRLDQENRIKLGYTRNRIVRFLIKQASKLNYKISIIEDDLEDSMTYTMTKIEDETQNFNNLNLQWFGDKSNLIEIIEALIVNGNLQGTKKDIYETFGNLFKEDLSDNAQTVSKFGNRNNDNETKFLNELRTSLLDEIKAKQEKKRR